MSSAIWRQSQMPEMRRSYVVGVSFAHVVARLRPSDWAEGDDQDAMRASSETPPSVLILKSGSF
jgi:hypothetical protein